MNAVGGTFGVGFFFKQWPMPVSSVKFTPKYLMYSLHVMMVVVILITVFMIAFLTHLLWLAIVFIF